jgi:hypothetical protein
MKIRLAMAEDASILAVLNQDVQRLHADALPHLFGQSNNVARAENIERITLEPGLSTPRRTSFLPG